MSNLELKLFLPEASFTKKKMAKAQDGMLLSSTAGFRGPRVKGTGV